MNIVKCSKCFTLNRVRVVAAQQVVNCGRCGSTLFNTSSGDFFALLKKYKYWFVLVLVIFGGVISEFNKSQGDSKIGLDENYTAPLKPAFNVAIVPVRQGIQGIYTTSFLVAPISISTPSGVENYFVKVVDAKTEATVITAFIFAGQSFELKVPLGQYKLKYASGDNWYGDVHYFGPNTSFHEADTIFNCFEDGYKINGYSINLIKRRNGNLFTRGIGKSQF